VKNRGYARSVKIQKGAVSITPDAVEVDRRFDGKFVLRTNTKLSPAMDKASQYSLIFYLILASKNRSLQE
jgi:hypothetical protein